MEITKDTTEFLAVLKTLKELKEAEKLTPTDENLEEVAYLTRKLKRYLKEMQSILDLCEDYTVDTD